MQNIQFLQQNTCFGKLNTMSYISFDSIKEFVDNYIYNHLNKSTLLPELSNMYILLADNSGNNSDIDNKWQNILADYQYDLLKKNKFYILGFILAHTHENQNNSVHYIDFIDTRVKKYNLAKMIIENYKINFEQKYNIKNCVVVPGEIIKSAVGYWKKYFEYLGVITNDDINKFIDTHKICRKEIKWYFLISLCNELYCSDSDSN
jgi:hypothetical protein